MNPKNFFIDTKNIINLNNLFVIFVSFIFIMAGFIVFLPKINSVESFSITWDVNMNIDSPDGTDDNAIFGEAPDANDGTPVDIYDVPHPPSPPEPYIKAWFNDGLAPPYEKLRRDYREYPDVDKIWNLTVMWVDITDSTTVTITWSTSEVAGSEYDSVLLYKDGSQIKDMLTQNSYSYTASPMDIQTFQIICHKSSNSIPNTPSNPNPYDGETNVDVNANLNWDGGDPDGDPVTYDIYFDTTSPPTKVSSNQSSTYYDPGTMDYDETYYWKIVAWDDKDASSEGAEWNFQTTVYNSITQANENPSQGDKNVDNKQSSVSVDIADINGNHMTWAIEVSAGDNNSSLSPVGNGTISCNLSTPLPYNVNIIWYVNVTNGDDWNNKTYSFEVESDPSGDNGGSGTIPPDTPIANAGGPYNSYIGGEITFDGSESTGSINSYKWELGDRNTTYGVSPTYAYTKAGEYIVNLTVTGPDGSDSDVTYVTITEYPNNPPTKPVINGPTTGHKNTDYEYTAISTDPDNDSIQYIFDWDDGEETTTEFLSNGTVTNQIHNWTSAGKYTISVKAYDNQTESASTEQSVLIDAWPIDSDIKGLLVDDDSDGIYDLFHNDTSGKETNVTQDNDKNYLIDNDDNGEWDFTYDIEKGLTPIHKEKEETPGFEIIILVISILIIAIFIRREHW